MKAVARATEAARSAGGTPCRLWSKEKPRLGSRTTIRLGAAKRRTMIQSGCEGAEVSGDSAQSPSPEKTKSARPAIRNERMADLAPVNPALTSRLRLHDAKPPEPRIWSARAR